MKRWKVLFCTLTRDLEEVLNTYCADPNGWTLHDILTHENGYNVILLQDTTGDD